MTLFGKFLLLFNAAAAAGFVYLATQDWKGRQTINAAGLKHRLLVSGLPFDGPAELDPGDETPFRVEEMPGGIPNETISKKLLDTYFAHAPVAEVSDVAGAAPLLGGGTVPNQLAEVRRVRAKIEDYLKKADKPEDKLTALRTWLLYQAMTFEERQEILDLLDPKTPAADGFTDADKTPEQVARDIEALEKRLAAKFDAVLNDPKNSDPEARYGATPADGDPTAFDPAKKAQEVKRLDAKVAQIDASRSTPLDRLSRQARAAHLLVHLNQDPTWQKRVMIVVGLRAYADTIKAQPRRFKEIADRAKEMILVDQVGYVARELTLRNLAIDYTKLSIEQASLADKWDKQRDKELAFVEQRKSQLEDLEKQLARIKTEVDELLARQSMIEQGLFEIQREVALTLDDVYKLEADLVARERELLGQTPPVVKQ